MLALMNRSGDDGDPPSTNLDDAPAEVREALGPVFAELDDLAELQSNWDSAGAAPITPVAIETAQQLLTAAFAENGADDWGESAIDVFGTPEGGLEIAWSGPNGELELTIQPDGGLSYMLMQDAGLDRRFEEGTLDDPAAALRQVGRVLM